MKLLKDEVDEHTVLTIRSRFRSYKYRKGHSKKTILMRTATHEKIMQLTEAVEADTFDEALEYLLEERYRSIWELPIEGGEESEEEENGDRENWHDQLQLVMHDIWFRKWRHQVAKLSCQKK